MDINKLDRIVLTQKEFEELFEWRDNNKDLVRNCIPVLDKGMILVGNDHRQVFDKDGETVLFTILTPDDKILYQFAWNLETKQGLKVSSKIDINEYEYNNTIISLYASLMAYMEYYGHNKEYVEMQERSIEIPKKAKKGSKKKKSVTRIKRKFYKFKINKEVVAVSKREYERHVEKWTVRGHWRQTKNGKVWIKPYLKGEGKEVTPKEYRL